MQPVQLDGIGCHKGPPLNLNLLYITIPFSFCYVVFRVTLYCSKQWILWVLHSTCFNECEVPTKMDIMLIVTILGTHPFSRLAPV